MDVVLIDPSFENNGLRFNFILDFINFHYLANIMSWISIIEAIFYYLRECWDVL
jgi:hypothetical protein